MASMSEQLKALYTSNALKALVEVSAALHTNPSLLDNEKDHAHQAVVTKNSAEALTGSANERSYF